jgi:hypothetical protein
MNNIVNATYTSEPLLQTWLLTAGVMVWIYRTDTNGDTNLINLNNSILGYFNNNLGGT